MARVERVFIYPIKSCRGVEVTSAMLTPRGLEFDRRFMLIDSNGRFLSQRRHPKMALIESEIDAGDMTVRAPGRDALRVPLAIEGAACPVRIRDDAIEATLAPAGVNIWFSEFLGFACGLVYLADHQHRAVPNSAAQFDDEVGFADGAPVLLISDASLANLNGLLPEPVSMRRFRPNLVVTADEPHAEDRWRSIAIGEARLDVAWSCSRCTMITVDPDTAVPDPNGEPMRTLREYRFIDRAVRFGQNLLPRAVGRIDRGAACRIDEIIDT